MIPLSQSEKGIWEEAKGYCCDIITASYVIECMLVINNVNIGY